MADTDTRGISSCWMPVWTSQLYPRFVSADGSYTVVGMLLPKFRFDTRPHSPFALTFAKSHSATKSWFVSVHERVALSAKFAAGLASRVNDVRLGPSRYLPMLALIAVLPFPNKSYAPPMRGDTFFQFGTLSISGNTALRFGTSGPGPFVSDGT